MTVCTDLLRPGGYARGAGYVASLADRMRAASARDVDGWILRAFDRGEEALGRVADPGTESHAAGAAALAAGDDLRAAVGDEVLARWVAEASLLNTETYVERATADPRYASARNAKPPRKVGTQLELLDCLTCDKCFPVCPNAANFQGNTSPSAARK